MGRPQAKCPGQFSPSDTAVLLDQCCRRLSVQAEAETLQRRLLLDGKVQVSSSVPGVVPAEVAPEHHQQEDQPGGEGPGLAEEGAGCPAGCQAGWQGAQLSPEGEGGRKENSDD